MADHENQAPAPGAQPAIQVLFSAEQIAGRVADLATAIAAQRLDGLLVIAVLKGSFVFAADLIRAMHRAGLSPEVDFMTLTSYRKGFTSSGTVEITRDIETDVRGRNVLIVDDILESGRTLAFAKDLISARGAKRVLTCVLLDKAVKRAVSVDADLKAFACPNLFVIGYGMDAGHRFRELPFVGRLPQS
jgi:hypoxanthine phosphoribosyltransferase